ncbi:MAG: hypothetical protein R3B11_17645 [Nitrospira sp.]|nr:hypothetical protein [Nitrospira sp.]
MNRIQDIGWWYWLATVGLLGSDLLGWSPGIWLAMTLCLIQIVHVLRLVRDVTAFPLQVRVAYAMLLAAGLWAPLQWVHIIQLIGTTARVLVGYCLLARTLSLAPWNRRQPLTRSMLRRTFFSPQTAAPPCGAIFDRLSMERVPS